MAIDALQPTLDVLSVHPKQEAKRKPGRHSRRDDKPGQVPPEQQEQPEKQEPQTFLNALGQLTGKNINITA